jgi:hypothetical protein
MSASIILAFCSHSFTIEVILEILYIQIYNSNNYTHNLQYFYNGSVQL